MQIADDAIPGLIGAVRGEILGDHRDPQQENKLIKQVWSFERLYATQKDASPVPEPFRGARQKHRTPHFAVFEARSPCCDPLSMWVSLGLGLNRGQAARFAPCRRLHDQR